MILDYNQPFVMDSGIGTPTVPPTVPPTAPGNAMQTIAIEGNLDSYSAEISGIADRIEE